MRVNSFGCDDPLASRDGMIAELLETAIVYPLILVVVRDAKSIASLQQILKSRAACEAKNIFGPRVVLPNCEVMFVFERDVDNYRGSVPVFYDPQFYRRAA